MTDLFKDKRVFHVSDSDLDGVASRIVAEYIVRPITSSYVPYNTAERKFIDLMSDSKFIHTMKEESDIILFTDLAPTPEIYDTLISWGKQVIIVDHHLTSREQLGEKPNYYFSEVKCGAQLFYDLMFEGKRKHNRVLDHFVNLVNVYDMWQEDHQMWHDAKGLSAAMYGYVPWSIAKNMPETQKYIDFIRAQLKKFDTYSIFKFNPTEMEYIAKAAQKERTAYQTAINNIKERIDGDGNRYAYIECFSKLSLVASRILKERKYLAYLIGYSCYDPTNMKVSVRSKGFDIESLVNRFKNGPYKDHIQSAGGHKVASGIHFLNPEALSLLKQGKIHLV